MSGKDKGTKALGWSLSRRIRERDGNKCVSCGARHELTEDPKRPGIFKGTVLEVDRIAPGKDGGLYSMENCRLLCGPCHTERHRREP